jgi:hypothetical protein
METTRFDNVVRSFGSNLTRRETVHGLFAGALAVVAGGAILEDASAKKRRKQKRRKKSQNKKRSGHDGNGGNTSGGNGDQFLPAGAFCQQDAQCDPLHTDRICDVAVNASNSDETCCGAQNATCGLPNEDGDDTFPFCCVGYLCLAGRSSSVGLCVSLTDLP